MFTTTCPKKQQTSDNLIDRSKENLHPWVRVDQACRPLPPKTLSILVCLLLNWYLCVVTVNKLKSSGRFCLFLLIFLVVA